MNKWNIKVNRSRPSKESLESTKDFEAVFQTYRQQKSWWKGTNQWMLFLAAGLLALGIAGWLGWNNEVASTEEPTVSEPIVEEEQQSQPEVTQTSLVEPKAAPATENIRRVNTPARPQRKLMRVAPDQPISLKMEGGALSAMSSTQRDASKPYEYWAYSAPITLLAENLQLPMVQKGDETLLAVSFAMQSDNSFKWEPVAEKETFHQLWFTTPKGNWSSYEHYLKRQMHEQYLLPVKDDNGQSFQFEFDPEAYPELSGFKNVEFEASAGFEPVVAELLRYSWRCTKFKRLAPLRYEATFQKLEEARTVEMHAVVSAEEHQRQLDSLEQLDLFELTEGEIIATRNWIVASPLNQQGLNWAFARFENSLAQSLQVARAFYVYPEGVLRIDPEKEIPYYTESKAKLYIQTTDNKWLKAVDGQPETLSDGQLRIVCEAWTDHP